MSLSPRYIFCSDCDFEQHYPCDDTFYKYHLPEGESILAPVGIGWCADCGEFVIIQHGLLSSEIKSHIRSLKNRVTEIKRFPFWKLSSYLKKQLNSTLFELSKYEKYLVVLGGRNSVHACLKCSGTEVFPVSNNIDTYTHIGCRGNFINVMDEEGIRLHVEIEDKFILPVYASDNMILDTSKSHMN